MKRVSNRTVLFFTLAAVSIILLILSSSGRLSPLENLAARGARPLLSVFNDLGRQLNNVFATARDLATLRSTNLQLQARVDTLSIDNARLKEIEFENQQLRELLQFRQLNPFYDFRGGQVIAQVISRAPTNYLSRLTIDLGAEHGIKPGMPVVTERGLVGRIQKVGSTTATILLITDPSSGVQALVKRETSRAVGIVNGRAGESPIMDFVAQDASIAPGDEIETSGLGGAFPKGLTIGQVIEVRQRDVDMFQQAIIRPTVNFDRLEFVLVIMNFEPLPGQPSDPESVG